MTEQTRYASDVKDDVRTLPKPYHDAIEHWQRHNFPDYPKLSEEWDRFFPQDHAWALRVMAEELRHGYQMVHLLTSADWSPVTSTKAADMVEEILSMQTGSHVLAAFNLEYDSFLDNVVFAAFIDRVGKYQLTMQKISAYKPYASSMPPMLREEAFHLAAGVIPLRRWVEAAARGDGYITTSDIQKATHKWFGRGLEMFGDERGGQTDVKFGLKDMAHPGAQDTYVH